MFIILNVSCIQLADMRNNKLLQGEEGAVSWEHLERYHQNYVRTKGSLATHAQGLQKISTIITSSHCVGLKHKLTKCTLNRVFHGNTRLSRSWQLTSTATML